MDHRAATGLSSLFHTADDMRRAVTTGATPGDPSTGPAGRPARQSVTHLASAYSKLTWTYAMLHETREMYHQHFDLRPVRFGFNRQPEKHRLVVTIHDGEDPQTAEFMRMGLVNSAAQVVHGARCVLDHLAYAIAKFQSPQATETQLFGVYFQVIENEERWDKQALGRLKLLKDETRAQMREMQVFVSGAQGSLTREGLVRLHNLDRTDRHRQLNVALIGTSTINFPKWGPPYACTEGGAVGWGPGP